MKPNSTVLLASYIPKIFIIIIMNVPYHFIIYKYSISVFHET